jgi:hypothetical protein
MTIMAIHSSATVREETPHVNRTTRTNTILNALKQRALSVLNDRSIDAQSRAIIRYALEINDPWLARLVRRAEAGGPVVDTSDVLLRPSSREGNSRDEKIGPLAEMICSGGEESAAALLILMATLEDSADPKTLAHTVKHLAFTRCGELNAYGIVDAQIAVIETELMS